MRHPGPTELECQCCRAALVVLRLGQLADYSIAYGLPGLLAACDQAGAEASPSQVVTYCAHCGCLMLA